jgi:hypothetical protein
MVTIVIKPNRQKREREREEKKRHRENERGREREKERTTIGSQAGDDVILYRSPSSRSSSSFSFFFLG